MLPTAFVVIKNDAILFSILLFFGLLASYATPSQHPGRPPAHVAKAFDIAYVQQLIDEFVYTPEEGRPIVALLLRQINEHLTSLGFKTISRWALDNRLTSAVFDQRRIQSENAARKICQGTRKSELVEEVQEVHKRRIFFTCLRGLDSQIDLTNVPPQAAYDVSVDTH